MQAAAGAAALVWPRSPLTRRLQAKDLPVMRDATHKQPGAGAPYRTAPPTHMAGSGEHEERWPPRLRSLVLVLLALFGWAVAIGWREHRLRADLRALPAAARQLLYRDTVEELRSVCAVQAGLREHCARQAELLSKFPECDRECRALADRFLDHARR
jgi:hypothetical protein